MSDRSDPIIIVGAGLAGALMACFLARRGFRVALYERRPDPRVKGYVGGRSINLALSARGIDALKRVGLAENILADAVAMPGRMIHSPTGQLAFQAYSKNRSDAINSVSRGGLNIALLNAAQKFPSVSLHFDQRCEVVDLDRPRVTFVDETTGVASAVDAGIVIGADGAFSAVRGQMQKTDRFEYSQSYLQHGYKELTIPPNAAGGFAMEPNALHIWPRGSSMMIALPNVDRSFTCTLFWPFDGPGGLHSLRDAEQVRRFFLAHYPDAVPLMPSLVADYLRNPVGSLVTIRCAPWHHHGKAVILGDAAHGIVPFFGQGMNAAFEDCAALDECVHEHTSLAKDVDWARAFESFHQRRKVNADAIADMALQNFIEMRDKTASRLFRVRKKVEHGLHAVLPRWFTPLYNMISFSTTPYAEARRIAQRQQQVVAVAGLALVLILAMVAFLVRRAMIQAP